MALIMHARARWRWRADPGECRALAEAYTVCLAGDGFASGARSPSLETVLSPPNSEADTDFMTLNPALVGVGGSGSDRAWGGDEGAVRRREWLSRALLLSMPLRAGNARGGGSGGSLRG